MNAENKKGIIWEILKELAAKKRITEIVINGPDNLFVERDGGFIQLNVEISARDITDFVNEVCVLNKKKCDQDNPILDGILPDGARVNIIHPPYAKASPAITIRRYEIMNVRLDENTDLFGLNPGWVHFFKALVAARMNLIVSGGTGAGKTTFINLLLSEIPLSERIVTIEDTLELQVSNPNVVRLEYGRNVQDNSLYLGATDLVKNALRMRPDRIILGEVRGGEFFDLLQAMNTGHEGSMSSIHANTSSDCFARMENLFLMAGFDLPLFAIKKQIADAVDFIIQLGRNKSGQRVITEIREITGMEAGVVLSQTIAEWSEDTLKWKGLVPECMQKLHQLGELPMNFFST